MAIKMKICTTNKNFTQFSAMKILIKVVVVVVVVIVVILVVL